MIQNHTGLKNPLMELAMVLQVLRNGIQGWQKQDYTPIAGSDDEETNAYSR